MSKTSIIEHIVSIIVVLFIMVLGGFASYPIVKTDINNQWREKLIKLELAHYEIDAKTGVSSFVIHPAPEKK